MVNIKSCAHPMDRTVMEKIFQSKAIKNLTDFVSENRLDDICDAALENSYARVPGNHPLYQWLEEGQALFGGSAVRAVYVTREYEYDTFYHGYSHPVAIIPSYLIQRGDNDILRARMLADAAAIAMEHHKLEFLIWVLDTLGGSIPLPLVPEVTHAALYEWFRSRRYTTDRAVWLATGDLSLSLRNILYGRVPFEMLDQFCFGGEKDTFLAQVEALEQAKGVSAMASKILGMVQKESWLPNRYSELMKYVQETKGGAFSG